MPVSWPLHAVQLYMPSCLHALMPPCPRALPAPGYPSRRRSPAYTGEAPAPMPPCPHAPMPPCPHAPMPPCPHAPVPYPLQVISLVGGCLRTPVKLERLLEVALLVGGDALQRRSHVREGLLQRVNLLRQLLLVLKRESATGVNASGAETPY